MQESMKCLDDNAYNKSRCTAVRAASVLVPHAEVLMLYRDAVLPGCELSSGTLSSVCS